MDEGRHYGLWFYLDGRIERVSSGGPTAHGRGLGDVLAEALSLPARAPARCIVKEENEKAREILETAGEGRIRSSRVDGYLVYTLR